MSEQLKHHEKIHITPVETSGEKQNDLAEKAEKDNLEHSSPDKLKEIHEKIEASAASRESFRVAEKSEAPRHSNIFINKELKNIAFGRTMTRVRKNLSYPDKVLSRVIHNPAVDKVSSVASSTVARPKSTLVAGITAFIASSLLLYIVRKYGYEYNYLFIILVFIAGYILGLLIELLLYALFRRKKAH